MKVSHKMITRLITLFYASLFIVSCTKDSDILSDYVIDNSQSILVQVRLVTVKNESITIQTSTVQEDFGESEIKTVDVEETEQELTDSGVKELDLEVQQTEEEEVVEQAAVEQAAAEQEAAEQEAAAEQAAAEEAAAEEAAAEQAAVEEAAAEEAAAEEAAAEQAAVEEAAAEQAAAEEAEAEQEAAEEAAAEQEAAEEAAAEQAAAEEAAAEEAANVVTVVTPPTSGTAEVNADNSITYTPDPDTTGTDEFEYTTQTETVTVQVETVNNQIDYWKVLFDNVWSDEYADAISLSKSGNKKQEYYYMAFNLDGLIQIWQATGDTKYLDDALTLIRNMTNSAKTVRGNYLGWPADSSYGSAYARHGVALWEIYVWKHVASLVRIMHQSPKLLQVQKYKSVYKELLAFTEKNIFEKWYTKHPDHDDIYLRNTHMASHWARIGMELYIITGKSKYREVFDNISFKGISKYSGASLRSRMYNNPKNPSALSWYQSWSNSSVQDTSHGSDVIAFIVTAHENNMYWDNKTIKGLSKSLNDIIWTGNSPLKYTDNVDGSGGSRERDANFHSFITLGRFDQNLQNRIKKYYTGSSSIFKDKKPQAFGVAALNTAILTNGRPVYPEKY